MRASFAVAHQNAKVMSTVHGKYAVKMAKALNSWVEDMDWKCALIDGSMLHQKV